MTRYTVKASRASDIKRIANRMREIDVREAAAFGHDPVTALRLGLRASTLCWTVWADDVPVAMIGCSPVSLLDNSGSAWALATDEAFAARRLWFSLAPRLVTAMLGEYRSLENYVSTENGAAIRCLVLLGASFDDDSVELGGVEFRRFHLHRHPPAISKSADA